MRARLGLGALPTSALLDRRAEKAPVLTTTRASHRTRGRLPTVQASRPSVLGKQEMGSPLS